MIEQNYQGYLLASHPKRVDPYLRRSTMLIMEHGTAGAIGLQINKNYSNLTLKSVMENIGLSLPNSQDYPLYNGGPIHTNRIHVIHTLDWFSSTTVKINDKIGVSKDISILTALAKNEGPEHFRTIAGYTKWLPGHLDGEILGEDPWSINHTWTFIPADINTLFGLVDIDQWHRVISESGRLQVSHWF